jgi:hypothetical protein
MLDARMISNAVDLTIASYTMMGLKADQERRQALREAAAVHIRSHVKKGQDDVERLVVLGLKHLVSLEDREPTRALRSYGS